MFETSFAAPAGMVTTTVPEPVMPLMDTLYVVPPPVTTAVRVPGAVLPVVITSALVKPVTASLNTTVKSIGEPLVGSAWVRA